MPTISKLDYLHPQDQGPQIVFDALPIETAKSFIVLLIVFCTCLGAVLIETVNHIGFDIALVRKPGWSQPTKLISRAAYLFCRLLAPACLLLVIVLLVSPLKDCQAVPRAFNALGMVLIDSVALIFVQRTMALYAWKSNVSIPLSVAYGLLVISTAFCIPFYGEGYRIPGTKFCAYDPHRDRPRTLAANITFKTVTMCLDLTLLVLTLHRLVDGGLRSIWTRSPRQLYKSIASTSFASFLVRQGFHFYIVQTFTEITFISIYYGASQLPYQVIGSALVFSIPPLAAAAAFRDMSVQATSIKTRDDSAGKENAYALQVVSGDETVTEPASGSKQSGKDSTSSIGGFHAVQLKSGLVTPASGARTSKTQPPRPNSRPSFGAHCGAQQLDSSVGVHNGILVTVGTRSRTDFVGHDSGHLTTINVPQIRTDAVESQAIIEMQRHWPRLASRSSLVRLRGNSHSDTTLASSDTKMQQDTGNTLDSEAVQPASPLLTHLSLDISRSSREFSQI